MTGSDGIGALASGDELCDRFRHLMEVRSGLVMDDRRLDGLLDAVNAVSREQGLAPESLLHACRNERGDAFESLVSRLTVSETYFFRNRPHFQALTEVVLPEIFQANEEHRRIRLWSAGCSTGEEVYSLAMVLHDTATRLNQDLERWDVSIVGSDINRNALERARAGEYGRYSFRGVTEDEIQRHFDRVGDDFRVAERYRKLVDFLPFNLKLDPLPDITRGLRELDLILCRNVTIYFAPETTQDLASSFHASLRPGGYLLVGHSEHSLETYRSFETHALPDAILYRRGLTTKKPPPREPEKPLFGVNLKTPVFPKLDLKRPPLFKDLPAAPSRRSATESPRPDRPSLAAARQALADGDPDRASALAVTVLEQRGSDPDACLFMGELAADRGHSREASIWLQRAVDLRPLDLAAHYVLSLLAVEQRELPVALERLERALYIDGDFVMGHYLAARLHRELGQPAERQRSLRTLRRLLSVMEVQAEVPFSDGLTVADFQKLVDRED
ncbi:MAG: CheR family methyltransferase [Acidobacteriota bacterium]